jgi:glycosyltransferase involved in cell wall biosynthesis
MKKKVCHLTSVHPAFDIRIFHKECISLVNAGFEVTLIVNGNEPSYQKQGVDIIPVQLPVSRFRRMLVVTFRFFKAALKTRASVFHFHDPELMPCGVLLRLAGKKVIFDIHENVRLSIKTKEWLPKGLRSLVAGIYFVVEKFCLMFYSQLILAEDSYLKYYPTHKCQVVLNYPVLLLGEKKYHPIELPIKMVYSGVVHELKGIWEMLFLVKELNRKGIECRLILIGEIRPESLKVEIDAFLEQEQLGSNIEIIGRVDFTEVNEILSRADVGLSLLKPIPNYYESLPTKIFEYMQAGLPVIANNFPLYKKYINQSGAGICVDISNMEQVAEEVATFLSNHTLLEKSRLNGINAVKKWYNWNIESGKLIEMYQNIVK